jgi:hypothetical protein
MKPPLPGSIPYRKWRIYPHNILQYFFNVRNWKKNFCKNAAPWNNNRTNFVFGSLGGTASRSQREFPKRVTFLTGMSLAQTKRAWKVVLVPLTGRKNRVPNTDPTQV